MTFCADIELSPQFSVRSSTFSLILAGACTEIPPNQYKCVAALNGDQTTFAQLSQQDGVFFQSSSAPFGDAGVNMKFQGINPTNSTFEESGVVTVGNDNSFNFTGSGILHKDHGELAGAGSYSVIGTQGSFRGQSGLMTSLNFNQGSDEFSVRLTVHWFSSF